MTKPNGLGQLRMITVLRAAAWPHGAFDLTNGVAACCIVRIQHDLPA
jgi:hypothetical protein